MHFWFAVDLSAPVYFRGTRSISHYLPTWMHFFLSQKVISTRCHQFATRSSWHCDTRRLYISRILAFSKLLRKLRLSPRAFPRLQANLKWDYFANTFFTWLPIVQGTNSHSRYQHVPLRINFLCHFLFPNNNLKMNIGNVFPTFTPRRKLIETGCLWYQLPFCQNPIDQQSWYFAI